MGQVPGSSHGNEHHILLGILLGDRMGKCQVTRVVVTLLELPFFFFSFNLSFSCASLNCSSQDLPVFALLEWECVFFQMVL